MLIMQGDCGHCPQSDTVPQLIGDGAAQGICLAVAEVGYALRRSRSRQGHGHERGQRRTARLARGNPSRESIKLFSVHPSILLAEMGLPALMSTQAIRLTMTTFGALRWAGRCLTHHNR